jgi:hypothetical protein
MYQILSKYHDGENFVAVVTDREGNTQYLTVTEDGYNSLDVPVDEGRD